MTAAGLVFGDGDEVVAMGRLVREGSDWWLDSARVSTLASRTAGGRSPLSTRLLGADAHVKALQAQDKLAARLWVHVVGRWQQRTITVTAIGAGAGRPDPHGDASEGIEVAPDGVVAELEAHAHDWGVERWSTGADGEPFVVVDLFRVTPDVAAWADTHLPGRVRLDPSVRRRS